MENNVNYLKMDGEKANFEGGAVRYTKTGKGRYDLIPGDVVNGILNASWENFYSSGNMTTSKFDIMQIAYSSPCGCASDTTLGLRSRYVDTIINLVNFVYTEGVITTDDNGIESKETSFDNFLIGFSKMLHELAIHYENGAEKYGVDNWKRGIPITGGNRGGSFTDSGLRHLNQWCQGLTDEPHHISCIWNFMGALWMMNKEDENIIKALGVIKNTTTPGLTVINPDDRVPIMKPFGFVEEMKNFVVGLKEDVDNLTKEYIDGAPANTIRSKLNDLENKIITKRIELNKKMGNKDDNN